MQDPAKELEEVITMVIAGPTPEVQKATLEKYYEDDAQYRHIWYAVSPKPNSRDSILGVLQWLRVMSPKLKLNVQSVTYNPETREGYLNILQEFPIRWSPLKAKPAKLLIQVTLTPQDPSGLYKIKSHEEFYHPDEETRILYPPFAFWTRLGLTLQAMKCRVNALVFGWLGFWNIKGEQKATSGDPNETQPLISGSGV